MYFILLDTMVNGIASLSYPSDILLLVYGNGRDFCILMLYPAILWNPFMNSSNILVASLVFSIY